MSLRVMEKFASIQGEGSKAGTPAVFIRLQGCTLTCPYCDSKQASRCLEEPKYIINTMKEAIDFAHKVATCPKDEVPIELFVITGGEPLLRSNLRLLNPFCNILGWEYGYCVDFETTLITSGRDLTNNYNVGQNLDFVLNQLTSIGMDSKENSINQMPVGNFVICPKFDRVCYPPNTDMENVFDFYTKLNENEVETISTWAEFKLVYYPEIHDNIMRFIDSWNLLCQGVDIDFNKTMLSIMPLTPIGDNYSREEYTKNCQETIEFCKKNGLIYSPRIQIDVWDLKTGV